MVFPPVVSSWRRLRRDPHFAEGARDMVDASLGIAAWGLVTGVAMGKGLGVTVAVMMSLLVFAGTAQLAALPLMVTGAPMWVIWATAICVNLRFVIFSAQWRSYFGGLPLAQRTPMAYFCADLNLAVFTRRFPEPRPSPEQVPYFWGGVAVNASAWHLSSLLGIGLAHSVPEAWGLGFAGTLALVGFIFSLLHDRGTWLAAVVAASASIAAFALPLRLNVVVAIAAAVAVGAVLDHLRPGRASATPEAP